MRHSPGARVDCEHEVNYPSMPTLRTKTAGNLSGNTANAPAGSPVSRTRLEQCLAHGEPSLVKCLLTGISRQSLKAVANCFLEDIPAFRAIHIETGRSTPHSILYPSVISYSPLSTCGRKKISMSEKTSTTISTLGLSLSKHLISRKRFLICSVGFSLSFSRTVARNSQALTRWNVAKGG